MKFPPKLYCVSYVADNSVLSDKVQCFDSSNCKAEVAENMAQSQEIWLFISLDLIVA